jgi:hypothetical protein
MSRRKTENTSNEMLPEYDFSGRKGVRRKYYDGYRHGHTVRVHKSNGTVEVKYFTLADGAVMLEADVREHFPDSRSVNRALRKLIATNRPRRRANHNTR